MDMILLLPIIFTENCETLNIKFIISSLLILFNVLTNLSTLELRGCKGALHLTNPRNRPFKITS